MSFHHRTRNLGLVRMRQPRSYFYRCTGCGSELIHTIDLALLAEPPRWWRFWRGPRPVIAPDARHVQPQACHCGGSWEPAGVPNLVNPDEGGDGMIFEVTPAEGWTVEVDNPPASEA